MSAWFRISDLDQVNIAVLFWLGEGSLVGKKQIRRGADVYAVKGADKKFRPLPDYAKPFGWRPIDIWSWPLPEPMAEVQPQKIKPVKITGDRYYERDDSIPKVRLGAWNEKPASLKETEARLLRAIRTQRYLDRIEGPVGPKHRSLGWPPALMAEAKAIEKYLESTPCREWGTLRYEDYQDFYIDSTNADARPARWVPLPRDISDVQIDEGNILNRWADHLTGRQWRVLAARAARPPFSWLQISENEKRSVRTCERDYGRAIETAHWRAVIG